MALTGRALCALAARRARSRPRLAAPAAAPGSFSHITVEDGLPHSYVRAIIKDRAGFMWFATARGLVRYDGAHLVVYRHDPNDPASLPFGAPTCLLEDRERRLWVGTASSEWAGIGVLDRSTGRFTRYLADGRPGSLSAPYVQAIYQDREGRLWVGHARGIDLFDPASKTFTAFPIGGGRQRAAGDGDAGGLARHLLGGHGEAGAVPVRQGHGHVSQLRRPRPGRRRASATQTTRSSPPFSSSRPAPSGWPATARASSASTWPAGERSATCPIRGAPTR